MVTIYTTSVCPYCHMVKEYLQKNNIKFKEVNVEEDEAAAREMIQKSHQMGVPVLDISGTIIVGFDKSGIDKALGL